MYIYIYNNNNNNILFLEFSSLTTSSKFSFKTHGLFKVCYLASY